jgi:hypothetical protein
MTWAMFAIGHWDAGDVDKAQTLFNRSFANVQEPYGVWTETPSGGTTNFITGAGGFLQAVINGLAGVRLGSTIGGGSSISFHPQCSSSLAASSGAVTGVCVLLDFLSRCAGRRSLRCAQGVSLTLRCRYFRGWRLTFEWTSANSNGSLSSTISGFKSPLNPDDAPPALAVEYQGKSIPLLEGKPLSFVDCPAIAVGLA